MKKNNKQIIPVIFASDNNYLPYLTTTLLSLAENASEKNIYEIWVLEQGINEYKQQLVKDMLSSYTNISINFINVDNKIDEYGKNIFHECRHFSKAVYYRLFIADIFLQYDKVLYLDSDIIIQEDVANLYKINISNNLLGAAKDLITIYLNLTNTYWSEYHKNILKIKNIANYLQSGVLIMNLKEMRTSNFLEKCLKTLKEVKAPRFVDQDILSSVCQNKVFYLPAKWNYYWHWGRYKNFNKIVPDFLKTTEVEKFIASQKSPSIIHYITGEKPWNYPNQDMAEIWWQYARKTPFYEEVLFKNISILQKPVINNITKVMDLTLIKEVLKQKSLKTKYRFYKILSKITFGKTHKKMKNKRIIYKERLFNIKWFLKGK